MGSARSTPPSFLNLNLTDEHIMKIQQTVLISALLLGSGAALAAGGGGGQASDAAVTAASGAMSSTSKAHMKKHASKATKPANDTTNMPGADASSDTKGH